MTRETIRGFAQLYDPPSMHLDQAAAKNTLLGERVGCGWQTLALTMRLLVDVRRLGATPIVGVGFNDRRLQAPLHPGDDGMHAPRDSSFSRPTAARIVAPPIWK
ncbi:MAG TPA: MaoC/PaaZ C-terminal domain-containing protein [Nevskiaceae bacterium]|nr:MaoC/PaaZ C-terminal domain-containing protein [Nevskiaceae bacterium]